MQTLGFLKPAVTLEIPQLSLLISLILPVWSPDQQHQALLGTCCGVGCHFLLQGIFPTQGLNPRFLHWEVDSLPLSHQGSSIQQC